jgi:HSP20 family protein
MLLRMDPFRELDRLFEAAGSAGAGTGTRTVPMDALRKGDRVHVRFDLPGIDPDSVDLTVERNQLTLTAERRWDRQEGEEWLVAERPVGRFTRQLFLGDNLDAERIEAHYEHGVLEVTIPVAEQAKPRKVSINATGNGSEPIPAMSSASSN